MGHEVTLLENDRARYALLEEEFEHVVQLGDATELYVLERCGVARADLVVAVTGDDEDNIIVCQVAKEKYGVAKVIARVNDPRNQQAFDILGISLTVSATATIMALIEHELPQHELVTLLDLGARTSRSSSSRSATTRRRRALVRDLEPARRLAADLGQPRRPPAIAVGDTQLEPWRPGDGDPRAGGRGRPQAAPDAALAARRGGP